MTVVSAVERDLALLAKRDPRLGECAEAAAALALAAELDEPGNSATSKSMCARALTETMERLRGMAPAEAVKDRLDELERKRAERLGAEKPAAKKKAATS